MSDTLKKLADAKARLREALADVMHYSVVADEQAGVKLGFSPRPMQHYWYVRPDGAAARTVNDANPTDVALIHRGVYRTLAEANAESRYREMRRYGARVPRGTTPDHLWCFHSSGAAMPFTALNAYEKVFMILAGNAFLTEREAEKYGAEVLPGIVKELLGK